MINKFTFDSSFLVPLISTDDIRSDDSWKFFAKIKQIEEVTFSIPMLVLFEVFHVLRRRGFFEKKENEFKFKNFFNFSCFRYFDLNFDFFNMFKITGMFNHLKTSDAIIASSALVTGSALITWDKKICENAFNAHTPTEFLDRFLD